MEFKKDCDYGKENNFIAEHEITVTITLDEYRTLVRDCATAERRIADEKKDKFERNSENERLKNENADLKAKMFEMQQAIDRLKEEEVPNDASTDN